jgi:hypothetical protein
MNPSTIVCAMRRNWTVWFTMWSTTQSAPAWQRIHMTGIGRARGWQAKAPAPRLAHAFAKCRNSSSRLSAGSLHLRTSPNPHLYRHFIRPIIPENSPVSPRPYLSGKPSDSRYLHENNHQTPKALFPFPYNGFRGSRFTRICRFAAILPQVPLYLCAEFMRPRLV